jgi:hypothetical protein
MPKLFPTARAAATAALPLVLALAGCATEGTIVLRDMGSFHVGGREVVVSGKPVTEIRRTPTGPLTKLDFPFAFDSLDYVRHHLEFSGPIEKLGREIAAGAAVSLGSPTVWGRRRGRQRSRRPYRQDETDRHRGDGEHEGIEKSVFAGGIFAVDHRGLRLFADWRKSPARWRSL